MLHKALGMADKHHNNTYRLAMIQMLVEPANVESNLSRASEHIKEAVLHGAKIAILPEAMDLGWTDPSARTKALEIPGGSTCAALCEMARTNAIYICVGLTEREGENIYNSAVIIDPEGNVVLKHRKVNELDIAHDLYDLGNGLNVISTPLGTIGLYICADALAEQNALSFSLGYMGADIILSPCAWAVPPDFNQELTPYGDLWRQVYEEVSRHFHLWVIGVSNVGNINAGPWQGWSCIGSSLAFAPGGQEVLQAPYGAMADTIEYIDVVLRNRPARGTKWKDRWI